MKNIMMGTLITGAFIATSLSGIANAASYDLDSAHTSVGFSVKHLGINNTKGAFQKFSGTFSYDPKKVEETKIRVEIATDSLDTGNPKRDEHVKSKDFLDAGKFPKITFVSKSVKANSDGFEVIGDLTIHGVTKSVALQVTDIAGPGVNPLDKKNHWGASATGKIKRQDFGITWNGGGATGIAGEAVIGDDVKLTFEIDGVEKT